MSLTPDILFHRAVAGRHPGGLADLDAPDADSRWSLSPGELQVLRLVRDSLNGALSSALPNELHCDTAPLYFNYIDTTVLTTEAFASETHSLIGMSVPMATAVMRRASRIGASKDVRQALTLPQLSARTDHGPLAVALLALLFIASHEYCHHVLGHLSATLQPDDPRRAPLRGRLQSQTAELAADGYAGMHLLEHAVRGAFRAVLIEMLGLEAGNEAGCDRCLFLAVLVAVAATWFGTPPHVLDEQEIYQLSHPPRAVRLSSYMRHATLWAARSPSLADVIDQQGFANLIYLAGLAAGDAPQHADARQQHVFMRSSEGRAYQKVLYDNLDLHKSLMGTYQ
jgi:hypothetical protein